VPQSLPDRVNAVRLLLESLNDYLPDPPTSSGIIARSSLPGPAPGRRVPCTYCRKTGYVRDRTRTRYCPVCLGTCWRTKERNDESWDEYTGERVADESEHKPEPMTLRQIEHELERITRTVTEERFGWERERRSYERQGSYQELRRALTRLEFAWTTGHLLIYRRYFRNVEVDLADSDAVLLGAAEEWVARDMRGAVRVPQWMARNGHAAKRKGIAELAADGLTPGQIARRLRLPKAKVRRVLSEQRSML